MDGWPARHAAASAPSGGCAAAGTAAKAAAANPVFARNFNMITLLLGTDAVPNGRERLMCQAPMALHIVQGCGQNVVAPRRNGEKRSRMTIKRKFDDPLDLSLYSRTACAESWIDTLNAVQADRPLSGEAGPGAADRHIVPGRHAADHGPHAAAVRFRRQRRRPGDGRVADARQSYSRISRPRSAGRAHARHIARLQEACLVVRARHAARGRARLRTAASRTLSLWVRAAGRQFLDRRLSPAKGSICLSAAALRAELRGARRFDQG